MWDGFLVRHGIDSMFGLPRLSLVGGKLEEKNLYRFGTKYRLLYT